MKQRMTLLVFVFSVVAGLSACGGSGGGSITLPPTITSVTIAPATATVVTGKTATFTASVTGTGNYSSSVTWTASAGTISSSGVLTAPSAAGTVTVTATSSQDPTKSGTATVTVVFPLAVSVSATPATVNAGDTTGAALAATLTGGAGNATVTWSVSPSTGSVSSTGPLTATYLPPRDRYRIHHGHDHRNRDGFDRLRDGNRNGHGGTGDHDQFPAAASK